LKHIHEQAESVNCQLSVCGEMAGDPLGAAMLFGLGYRNFSMSASSLLRVKSKLLAIDCRAAQRFAKRALTMSDVASVVDYIASSLDGSAPRSKAKSH
jgi:phosphotransferase system enzyme I (PtsP)